MSENEQTGPETRDPGESEITELYRGLSGEDQGRNKSAPNHVTLSVWAAALILCSVLVFSVHQLRGALQGIRETLERVGDENKLLLEGLDELLVRADQPGTGTETASIVPEPQEEEEAADEQEDGEDVLARKYKIYYRAKEGEDLTVVSGKFGVSEEQIRLWNALKATDSIVPGQVLVINKSTQTEEPVMVARAAPSSEKQEAVKEGEPAEQELLPSGSVSGHGTGAEGRNQEPHAEESSVAEPEPSDETVEALASSRDEPAPVAQEDRVDGLTGETVHTVRKGESLSAIGQQYGVSWLDLAKLNAIDPPGTIFVGQRLRIPEGSDMEEAPPPTVEVRHRVKPGENLYRIGLAYDVTWKQIARANGITHPSQLYAGQVLKIPVAKGGPER